MAYNEVPESVQELMDEIKEKCGQEHARWAENFQACFANTLLTTVRKLEDGTIYVLTGDIPAMWLRDSVAQVRPYLVLAEKDAEIASIIAGVVERQFQFVCLDPYANAFNETANGAGHQDDATHFNETFVNGVKEILKVWEVEQNHNNSSYKFQRDTTREEDTLANEGKGTPIVPTGMTWSGFRPSDDSCEFGYLVPSNMFAVVVLDYLKEIFTDILKDESLIPRITKLRAEIQSGIEEYAKVKGSHGETIYAYEVDGIGGYNIMDDSNVPSLLSAPYLGFCDKLDPTYLATRKVLLSKENPYFYEGALAKGIGSSHTPEKFVWPIAMAMEGLTTDDKAEKQRILDTLVACDAGTNLMHEGFHVDDQTQYTREWFSWANMMFCELVMDYFDIRVSK